MIKLFRCITECLKLVDSKSLNRSLHAIGKYLEYFCYFSGNWRRPRFVFIVLCKIESILF